MIHGSCHGTVPTRASAGPGNELYARRHLPDRSQRLLLHARLLALVAATLFPPIVHASFLPPALLDTAADIIALLVLFVVPVGVLVVFWLVHILPEKAAEKRQHPQKEAIKAVCLLSLFFGGMLWPLAWIWAYTKPVGYKLAYGTDKHDDYYKKLAHKDAAAARALQEDVTRLRLELEALEKKGVVPAELRAIREQLAVLESKLSSPKREGGAS